jgi:3-dehydroquinate synthase
LVEVYSSPEVGRVIVGRGSLHRLKGELEPLRPFKVMVVTTERVAKLWLSEVLAALGRTADVMTLEDGEPAKDLKVAERLLTELLQRGFTRRSLLLALGGGALCDVVGFTASIYMRGTLLSLVPTTLLAQVDAAIGGKTGVNLGGKNVVGTFYPAHVTIVDVELLTTLPKEELANGMAEVVKYGVALDRELFELIEPLDESSLTDVRLLEEVVRRCVEEKIEVAVKDPREEAGERMKLNFGHTVGHAVERLSGLKHGQAISIGMVCECRVAELTTGFRGTDRVESTLKRLGLPTRLNVDPKDVLKLIRLDKKSWYGRPVLALPTEVGSAVVKEVEEEAILRALGEAS